MISFSKIVLIVGSLNAFLAVALGAFGAHGLKSRVSPELMNTWHTAVQYHLFHALGLILLAIIMRLIFMSTLSMITAGLMFMGILFFSGSLYLLVLTGNSSWGMITPIGGVLFLISWILLAIDTIKYF